MASPAYTEQSLGKRGSEVVSDTAAHAGRFVALVAGPDGAIINSITIDNKSNASALAGLQLPAGYTTYGNITSVTLTSGVVELYNA